MPVAYLNRIIIFHIPVCSATTALIVWACKYDSLLVRVRQKINEGADDCDEAGEGRSRVDAEKASLTKLYNPLLGKKLNESVRPFNRKISIIDFPPFIFIYFSPTTQHRIDETLLVFFFNRTLVHPI